MIGDMLRHFQFAAAYYSGVMFDKDVDVFARVHDGGKDPNNFDVAAYSDNFGHYPVWLILSDPAPVPWIIHLP
jgi:hypothetical protein